MNDSMFSAVVGPTTEPSKSSQWVTPARQSLRSVASPTPLTGMKLFSIRTCRLGHRSLVNVRFPRAGEVLDAAIRLDASHRSAPKSSDWESHANRSRKPALPRQAARVADRDATERSRHLDDRAVNEARGRSNGRWNRG